MAPAGQADEDNREHIPGCNHAAAHGDGGGVRRGLKRTIEGFATASGLASLLARRVRGRRLILAYHNVVPPGERAWGETALHVPAARFEEHLAEIGVRCSVVPLDELLAGAGAPADRPIVAITFDDGYVGALEAGADALARAGLPATFFVNPGLCGEDGFWWDRLAAPKGGTIPDAVRNHCLAGLRGEQRRVLDWAPGAGHPTPEAPAHARPASAEGLRAAARAPGTTLASHTWSHPNLARLAPAERAEELERAAQWLGEAVERPGAWLSYPYGLYSEHVRGDAARAGLAAALRVEGGWLPPNGGDAFAVPRLNVPAGLSADGLALRLAGVWGGGSGRG